MTATLRGATCGMRHPGDQVELPSCGQIELSATPPADRQVGQLAAEPAHGASLERPHHSIEAVTVGQHGAGHTLGVHRSESAVGTDGLASGMRLRADNAARAEEQCPKSGHDASPHSEASWKRCRTVILRARVRRVRQYLRAKLTMQLSLIHI